MPRDYYAEEIESQTVQASPQVSQQPAKRDFYAEEIEGKRINPTGKTLSIPKPQKIDVLDAMAGVSPEELAAQGHPIGAAIQQAGKDLVTAPAHFLNQMLLNAPRSLANTAGFQYPEKTDNPVINKVAQAAGVAGALTTGGLALGAKTLPAKMAAGAAEGFAYSPTENFSDIKQRTQQAAFGGTIPVVGKTAKLGINLSEKLVPTPERIINSVIRPIKKEFAYGKNPGRAIAREGIVANTVEELGEKVNVRLDEVGNEIANKIAANRGVVTSKGILDPLENALAEAGLARESNSGLINRIEAAKNDIGRLIAGRQELPVAEAHKIKQVIGKITKWTGAQSDDSIVNKALQKSYASVRTKINSQVPGLAEKNALYADLLSAKNAIEHRVAYAQRNNLNSLTSNLSALTVGVGSFANGVDAIPAIVFGYSAQQIVKAMGSPAVKTRVARILAKTESNRLKKVFRASPEFRKAVKGLVRNGELKAPSRVIDALERDDEAK